MNLDRLLKIGEFEVDRHGMSDAQILLLALAIDPSEKQKQVLDAFGIQVFDYNGKLIYPRSKPTPPTPPKPADKTNTGNPDATPE